MPVSFYYDVPGNPQLYNAVQAEIGRSAPEGLILHLVLQVEHRLRHVMIWDNPEDWERFRTGRVEPAVRKVLASAGIPEPPARPDISPLELVDVWIPGAVPATQR
jgi:hypothetical protein